jgi:hypothetical protein
MSFLRDSEKMNSVDLYNMNDKAKTSRPSSDSYLVLDSADRSTSSVAPGTSGFIPTTQPYNDFRLQKPENLLQGGFTRLSLTEVRFPYAIPNVNNLNGSAWFVVRTSTGDIKHRVRYLGIPGLISGYTLADILQTNLQASPIGTAIGVTWIIQYIPGHNPGFYRELFGGFIIRTTATTTYSGFAMFPVEPTLNFPNAPTVTSNPKVKSLLDLMGFSPVSNWDYITKFTTAPSGSLAVKVSSYAPMTYTTFIDVISSKLTYYQNVKDGSTKAGSQDNIICRLYVTDESSTTPTSGQYWNTQTNTAVSYVTDSPPGSIPFVIHRQFVSPKQFLWDKNTAIDWIDIKLLDDFGNPLFIPEDATLPDFQITFKATED